MISYYTTVGHYSDVTEFFSAALISKSCLDRELFARLRLACTRSRSSIKIQGVWLLLFSRTRRNPVAGEIWPVLERMLLGSKTDTGNYIGAVVNGRVTPYKRR